MASSSNTTAKVTTTKTEPKAPKVCGFCGDALTDENVSDDNRACRLCFRYVTQSKCDCGNYYEDCTCPCADCGERLDSCVCHYTAEGVAETKCTWCHYDPCECAAIDAREAEYDGVKRKTIPTWFHDDMDESKFVQRCPCGVRLTGYEGWGGYCSRQCSYDAVDRD